MLRLCLRACVVSDGTTYSVLAWPTWPAWPSLASRLQRDRVIMSGALKGASGLRAGWSHRRSGIVWGRSCVTVGVRGTLWCADSREYKMSAGAPDVAGQTIRAFFFLFFPLSYIRRRLGVLVLLSLVATQAARSRFSTALLRPGRLCLIVRSSTIVFAR